MQIKYSFIVPTYNSKRWIKSCITSILTQTYPDFNLIILDSGSSDGTVEWLNSLSDSRINIYITQKRLSIVENWSRIISIPRNEFMTIAGHDDVFHTDYLDTINELILNNPQGGLYQTQFNFIDSSDNVIRKCKTMLGNIDGHEFLKAVLKDQIEITATGFMLKTMEYDKVGGIKPYPDLLYADIALWHQLILDRPLIVSPKICFGFRTHSDNTSKSFTLQRLTAFEMLVNYLQKLRKLDREYDQLIIKYGNEFLNNFVKGSCHKLIYVPKNHRNYVTMREIIKTGEKCSDMLEIKNFHPKKTFQIIFAELVDKNKILRNLFLFWKSFFKRVY